MHFNFDFYIHCTVWHFRGHAAYGSAVNLKNNNKAVGGKHWKIQENSWWRLSVNSFEIVGLFTMTENLIKKNNFISLPFSSHLFYDIPLHNEGQ